MVSQRHHLVFDINFKMYSKLGVLKKRRMEGFYF
jgi:hypothetical protein